MRNKFIKDFAIVVFAYYWALSLINRLVGMIIHSLLPGDPAATALTLMLAFVLSYAGVWFFFNKWKARFWVKACIAVGVIVVSYMIGTWIDMNAVYNMSHR